MPTLADRLAAFAARTTFASLPRETVHEAKRRVIDSISCALGAFDAPPVRAARAVALTQRGAPGATLLGTASRSTPELACFVNGTMVRYFDFNDTYLSKEPAHPSDNLAAVLAAAEAVGAGGKELIAALVVAYEVQCRLCDAASLRAHGWDHVTYGAFSVTLGAAKVLGLSRAQMVHAMGIAGVAGIATRQTRVGVMSMWKASAFANAARNGLFAARLAKAGMTGPAPIFEGEKGYWKLVTGPFRLLPLGGRGRPFMLDRTYIKYYPVEYHAQGAVGAALRLRGRIGDPARVRAIAVDVFDAAVDIIAGEPEKWRPRTRETADHSLPYCVAVALADGDVWLEQFDERRIRDPRLLALVQRVKVRRDAAFSRAYPAANPVRLTVRTADGRTLVEGVRAPRGHELNPMTDAEVEAKFRRLVEGVLPRARADKALDRMWNLDRLKNVRDLMACLRVE